MNCPLCADNHSISIGTKNNCHISQCENCQFIFMNPMPKATKIEDIYDDYRQTKNYLNKLKKKIFTSKHKLRKLKKYLNANQNEFLDVGCSIGATVEAANRLGYSATGIDLDSAVIEQAKKLFTDCQFHPLSTDELVAKNKQFDLVYCAEVIEHVPDPHAFMQSLSALVKLDGILYLTTPDAGHRKVPKDFVSWKQVIPPEHIIYFNRKNMNTLLVEHGFEAIKFKWNHRANMRVICRKIAI